ncbi:Low temperature viability protein-domain-containing protein [Phlebopus sp. FC_14]|nr:Low temperature viability protein-domain-containing protein [Phlebopus sp. FC_14]
MPPKSIFRQPGAKHFQLVHRSQRDPLIHDPDASQHVLKAVVRRNDKKGESRAELEAILDPEEIAHDAHANVGEAALYGVYFDDTEYDYMQHLRAVGAEEEGVESILIEAPQKQTKGKCKGTSDRLSLRDLPPEVLPSQTEMPRDFEAQKAVPSSISGFQPDMNPHLRQVLEALEDDAFVDDSTEDDFFAELVADGERNEDEDIDFEFYEYGEPKVPAMSADEEAESNGWEARFARFQEEKKARPPTSDTDDDVDSEGGDTVGNLPKLPVIGGKRRRKGSSDASGYSMSSSSMYRTEALLTLDERFDQLMEKEYSQEEAEGVAEEETPSELSDSDEAPELITSREDFAAMVEDFMGNFELLGRKLKPVLPGDSGAHKLDTLRRAMGQDERVRITTGEDEGVEDEDIFAAYDANVKEDRWDCETILTTYSNLENHPRIIRTARTSQPVPKIKLDSRTGFPSVDQHPGHGEGCELDALAEHSERGGITELSTPSLIVNACEVIKKTITRPRDETKEEKKLRKQAVKAERQARRADKKAVREQFNSETTIQAKGLSDKARSSRLRKL